MIRMPIFDWTPPQETRRMREEIAQLKTELAAEKAARTQEEATHILAEQAYQRQIEDLLGKCGEQENEITNLKARERPLRDEIGALQEKLEKTTKQAKPPIPQRPDRKGPAK